MLEAKILLEINSESINIDIQGDQTALEVLLIISCEHDQRIEDILKHALDYIYKKRLDEATSDLHTVQEL